jgi:hypothetical protein
MEGIDNNVECEEKNAYLDTYEIRRSRSTYFEDDLVVIPAKVKIPLNTFDMLDQFIIRHCAPAQRTSIKELINYVFREWAEKVTTDYKEFG